MTAEQIRVRGLVQGVGFRPKVWRIASELGLTGDVRNDGEGVLVRLWAKPTAIDAFCRRLLAECPPLARIEALERAPLAGAPQTSGFQIAASNATAVTTGVAPDAATCEACRAEIRDPANRRFRYPFTNCTHCGPRLSIVRRIPYDRSNTSMSVFPMCPRCRAEYEDPADRRFHAQPNACSGCGPQVWLEDRAGRRVDVAGLDVPDAIAAVAILIAQGRIVAVKGIGGFHLACDAANEQAVAELRRRKRRFRKPFALMARDLEVIDRYAWLGPDEAEVLRSPAAPILLLERRPHTPPLATQIAPGQASLGFMLPYSPLHDLLLAAWDRPLVMTSGNLSDEPQCIENTDAGERLGPIADFFLLHDREIVNRMDDSVVRPMDGVPRFLRRARGYAPSPIALPEGLAGAPPILALGGALKSTFCLARDGRATLSQHLGDLEEARTAEEYERTLSLYLDILQLEPAILAVDAHPDYRPSRIGRAWAARDGRKLERVQHHHAHIASVLAESGWATDAGPVLGVALDGLGYGEDGSIWGGEFLYADYGRFERAGHLATTPMPGGVRAILEPWRNTWAHLAVHLGWEAVRARWPDLPLVNWLATRPLDMLSAMLAREINSPRASSCGRLFDAVAAALGIARDAVSYEGQAAIELEALAAQAPGNPGAYPLRISSGPAGRMIDPAPLWETLLDDLAAGAPTPVMAARFHAGLAEAVVSLACALASDRAVEWVALSGGVLQNRILFEAVAQGLRRAGLEVLAHRLVPANDGGLSLGQAAVAAARCIGR